MYSIIINIFVADEIREKNFLQAVGSCAACSYTTNYNSARKMCKGRLPSYDKGSKNDAYLKRWHSLTRMFRYSRGAARPTVAHLLECTREHTHSQTHCRHSERWREKENIEKKLTGKESKEKSEDEKEDSSDTKPETGNGGLKIHRKKPIKMGGKPVRKKERERDKLPRNTNKRMTAKEDKKRKKNYLDLRTCRCRHHGTPDYKDRRCYTR